MYLLADSSLESKAVAETEILHPRNRWKGRAENPRGSSYTGTFIHTSCFSHD